MRSPFPPSLPRMTGNPMNQTLDLLNSHRSDRSYTDEPVSDEAVDAIVQAAYRAPTAMNAQHVSIVVTRDAAKRARISAIAKGQAWIAKAPVFITVVLDFHKTAVALAKRGKAQAVQNTVEGLIAATTDVGIVLATMMAAARSLGLGIVPIGSVRADPRAMVDLLGLPKNCLPIVGLCIGHIEQPASLKPRLPIGTFRHDEIYDDACFGDAIDAYDRELVAYMEKAGRKDPPAWSQSIASVYDRDARPDTRTVALAQGFKII